MSSAGFENIWQYIIFDEFEGGGIQFEWEEDHKLFVKEILEKIYGTASGKILLDKITSSNPFTIVAKAGETGAAASSMYKMWIDPYLYLENDNSGNVIEASQTLMISEFGRIVSMPLARVLTHELYHAIDGTSDASIPYATPEAAKGETVTKTNSLIEEYNQEHGTSYESRISYYSYRESVLSAEQSLAYEGREYTFGNKVDLALTTSTTSLNHGLFRGDFSGLYIGRTTINSQGQLINDNDFQAGDKNDYLYGNYGDDLLVGGRGNDVIDGGVGTDTAEYTHALTSRLTIEEVVDLKAAPNTPDEQDEYDIIKDIEIIRLPSYEDMDEVVVNLLAEGESSVESIFGSEYEDKVTVNQSAATTQQQQMSMQLMSGMMLTEEGGDYTELHLGGGDDELTGNMNNMIVYSGEGADSIEVGTQYLFADASADDRLTHAGDELHGGIRYKGSESPYAIGLGGIRYGINVENELMIQLADSDEFTFIAGYKDGIDGNGSGGYTAGIGVGEMLLEAYRLFESPYGYHLYETLEALVGYGLKFLTGESYFKSVDPLVLDLDGDGIELSAQSSAAPLFDIDGDGFAERSGWVQPDDGFLVRDLNANGVIDDVHEMFGDAQQSGFDALSKLDDTANGGNADGIIDAQDSGFADLAVWQDANGDGITDSGELLSMAEVGIESISLANQASGFMKAGNSIDATGTFTFTDQRTGAIADVGFDANHRDTVWLGDDTVSTAAAALPNVAGQGTLTNLHIAMTDSASLLSTVENTLPSMNTVDLSALRTVMRPILDDWRDAIDVPAGTPGTTARGDVLIQVGSDLGAGATVHDFAYVTSDQQGSYLLRASGTTVVDENDVEIERPDSADIMAQVEAGKEWVVLTGEEIQFLERYIGNEMPIDMEGITTGSGAIEQMTTILDVGWSTLNEVAVRLAMQGPLSPYFVDIEYDAEDDVFYSTGSRQIAPMLEAIFADAPGGVANDVAYLEQWKPFLDVFLQDFDRGEDYLIVSYSFLFQNVVAAYENVGVDASLIEVAGALDIPDDLIQVGTGLVEGTGDADLFYLGAGNQTLEGGAGPDAYIVGQNFGQDVIYDIEDVTVESLPDMLRFAQHQLSELEFSRDGNDLIIDVIGETDSIRVVNQFKEPRYAPFATKFDPEYGIKEIVFAGGEVWDKINIAKAVSFNTTGDDSLVGTDATDFLDGGLGNDTLVGGMNADIYSFGAGDGQDVIYDNMDYIFVDSPDIVSFKEGITLADLDFTRVGNSDDLIITINGTSDQLIVQGQFTATQTGPFGIQWLTRVEGFYDSLGNNMLWDDLFPEIIAGLQTENDDTIYGFAAEDEFRAGAGNDYLSGGDYGDTYYFNVGDGQDTIEDNRDSFFAYGDDRIVFGEGIAVEDTYFERVVGTHDMRITFEGSSDSILVKNHYDIIETGLLGWIEFNRIESFEWADDTTKHADLVEAQAIEAAQTSGDDLVEGTHFDDMIIGGLGNDTLKGGNGHDTYIFNLGDGQDTISDELDNVLAEDGDTLEFGVGIAQEDIVFTRSGIEGEHLTLSISGTTDTVHIDNQFLYYVNGWRYFEIESFVFADNTSWTVQDVQELYLAQESTSGNDIILAFDTDDSLTGGAGNDTLRGGDGSDSYYFSAGFGQDIIEEAVNYVTYGSYDAIVFDSTIDAADAIITRSGYDLIISFSNSSDTISITDQFSIYGYGASGGDHDIERVFFEADSTEWSDTDIREMILASEATSGNDSITGFWNSDVIEAGAGNDTMSGLDGADVYVFDSGFGQDVIQESVDSIFQDLPDTVEFKHLNLSDVSFAKQGNDLLVSDNNSTDTVTIIDHFNNGDYNAVEFFKFANGDIVSAKDVLGTAINAQSTSGDDLVIGTYADDILNGGLGNDTLKGEDGDNAYIFSDNFGTDVILDNHVYGWDGDTSVTFENGYTLSKAQFSRDGMDLTISFAGYSDSVTIEQQFISADAHDVEHFYFSDGSYLSSLQVQQRMLLEAQTSGNDSVIGFVSDDTIEAGLGNDYLEGAGGGDTYLFGYGDGQDTINDGAYSDTPADRLLFDEGIAADDMTFNVSGSDLLISMKDSADSLQLQYQFGTYAGIEFFEFADGSIMNGEDIAIKAIADQSTEAADEITATHLDDEIRGGAGNDTIYGMNGDDTIRGGAGDDTLDGGEDSDTYIYELGDGHDVIIDQPWASANTLQFASPIKASDLTFLESVDGNDLTIAIRQGGSVMIKDYISTYGDAIETILTVDAALSMSDVAALVVTDYSGDDYLPGTSGDDSLSSDIGNDSIYGYDGNDTLEGGAGNDLLKGGEGNDVYVYNLGDGDDVIEEYDGIDTLRFGSGIRREHISLSMPDGLLISVVGGGSITVDYHYLSGYELDNIHFTDTGETFTVAELLADEQAENIVGTSGHDTLLGWGGNDTINGGDGNDYLTGGNGDDLFVFDEESNAADIITDFASGDKIDLSSMSAITGMGDITISDLNGDSLIQLGNNQTVRLFDVDYTTLSSNDFSFAVSGPQTITGGYGDETLTGGAGDDLIQGNGGNDTFEGKGGNDTLEGSWDNDTYIYNTGDGNDWISEGDGTDTLIFGTGIEQTDLSFSHTSSDDLVIDIAGGGSVTIAYYFNQYWYEVDTIQYDGGSYSASDIRGIVLDQQSTAGNDYIEGFYTDDSLTGGLGDDSLYGGYGNDDYFYNQGDGDDFIWEDDGTDTLYFGTGIEQNDLTFSHVNSYDLQIDVAGGGSVTIGYYFNQYWYEVETIQYDGGSYSASDIRNIVLDQQSTTGNDSIQGFYTDDSLEGGLGDDSLYGGYGDDDYFYNLGDGDDFIWEDGGTDTLYFGTGIEQNDLTFSQVNGYDLQIDVAGGGSVLIQDHFNYYWNEIESVVYDGGSYTATDIANMV